MSDTTVSPETETETETASTTDTEPQGQAPENTESPENGAADRGTDTDAEDLDPATLHKLLSDAR